MGFFPGIERKQTAFWNYRSQNMFVGTLIKQNMMHDIIDIPLKFCHYILHFKNLKTAKFKILPSQTLPLRIYKTILTSR